MLLIRLYLESFTYNLGRKLEIEAQFKKKYDDMFEET